MSMASFRLGAPIIKVPKLALCKARLSNLQLQSGLKTCIGARHMQYKSISITHRSEKAFSVCFVQSFDTESVAENVEGPKDTKSSGLTSPHVPSLPEAVEENVEVPKETQSSELTSPLIPHLSEVELLVTELCNTSSIAEFELKLEGFRLYVKRDLVGEVKVASWPVTDPAPVSANPTVDAHVSNGEASSTSLAIIAPVPSSSGIDRAADAGLFILLSPKVGFFQRSRTIKGKRTPPSCTEGQMVKEGQVLGYVNQLGCEIPIESDVSGEVVKILRDDGEPIGYGDALIEILPSFPGIKNLQ